jgi:hypothetical protein
VKDTAPKIRSAISKAITKVGLLIEIFARFIFYTSSIFTKICNVKVPAPNPLKTRREKGFGIFGNEFSAAFLAAFAQRK